MPFRNHYYAIDHILLIDQLYTALTL